MSSFRRVHGADVDAARACQHRSRPAFLFSFTDAPVMKALDLYREEAKR